MIDFSSVPSSAIASGVFVEQEAVARGVGALKIPQKIALFGQYNSGKSPVNYAPRLLNSADEAASLYGVGSMLHLMARKAFKGAGIVPIYAFPIPADASASAATGSITVTGTTTSRGTIALFISGQKVSIAIPLASSAADVASAIVSAIGAAVNLPVTASLAGSTVNLESKWKGESANTIKMALDLDDTDSLAEPSGISIVFSQLSGGATDPSTAPAFDAMGATFFTQVAYPYDSAAQLATLDEYWTSRISPEIKKPFLAIIGNTETIANFTSRVTNRNSPVETYVNAELAASLPCEIAASAVAVCAKSAESNPARPWKNLVLPGIRAGTNPAFTYAQHNSCQSAGGGTTDPLIDGTVKIHDLVTTYKTNALGADDDVFRYPETIANIQAKIYSLDNLFSSAPFDRAIVVDDKAVTGLDYAMSPKRVKSFVLRLIDELWIPNAWSKNRDDIVASIEAEIDASNPGRINVGVGDILAAGLRVIAIKYRWAFAPSA